MNAFIIGLLITLLTLCFAYQTGAALNPSRDFGPRLALLALGYPKTLFTNPYWLYGPWAGSLAGSALGAFIYDAAVFTGVSFNYSSRWRHMLSRYARRRRARVQSIIRGRELDEPCANHVLSGRGACI